MASLQSEASMSFVHGKPALTVLWRKDAYGLRPRWWTGRSLDVGAATTSAAVVAPRAAVVAPRIGLGTSRRITRGNTEGDG